MKTKLNRKIEEIVENVKFERIHDVMTRLDWKWYNVEDVPSVGKIILFAIRQLKDVYELGTKRKRDVFLSSGGFTSRYYHYDESSFDLSLSFHVEEYITEEIL